MVFSYFRHSGKGLFYFKNCGLFCQFPKKSSYAERAFLPENVIFGRSSSGLKITSSESSELVSESIFSVSESMNCELAIFIADRSSVSFLPGSFCSLLLFVCPTSMITLYGLPLALEFRIPKFWVVVVVHIFTSFKTSFIPKQF